MARGKAPAFQFYPADYIKDTRVISLQAKGAWIDLLSAMWLNSERGKVTLSWVGFSRLFGAAREQSVVAVAELVENRICDALIDCTQCTQFSGENVECAVTKSLSNREVADCNANVTFLKRNCNANVTKIIEQKADGKHVKLAECNGNVTLINRRMVRDENARISTRSRVGKHRAAAQKRECNADVTHVSSSLSSLKKEIKQRKRGDEPKKAKAGHGAEIAEVIADLNAKAGTSYKAGSKATVRLIEQRLAEGFTLEDFKAVNKFKVDQWLNDPKYKAYLRPETLYSEKFEGYLNGARMQPPNQGEKQESKPSSPSGKLEYTRWKDGWRKTAATSDTPALTDEEFEALRREQTHDPAVRDFISGLTQRMP